MRREVDVLGGGLLFSCLLVLGLLVVSAIEPDRRFARLYRQLFIAAMVLRFAASLAIYVFGFVNVLGDEDALAWEGAAAIYADWSQRGLGVADLPAAWTKAFQSPMSIIGYQFMVATLFFLTDEPSRLLPAVLNNFFGAMTVVLAARVGSSLFSPWVGSRVGWCACLFPSLIVWSAQTLKEPVIIFLETIALYACIRLQGSRASLGPVVACATSIVFLVCFRFYAAYVTAAVIFLTLAVPHVRSGRTRFGAALAVGAIVAPVLILTGALAQHEAAIVSFDLRRLQDFRDWSSHYAASGVPLTYDLGTPIGFLLSLGIGAMHLLLAPFPWQLSTGSTRMLLTLPEIVVWWWLVIVGLLPGLRLAVRARFASVQPLVYFILGMAVVYSLTFSNLGLIYRQRAQLLPWLLVFVMVGLEQRAARKRMVIAGSRASIPLAATSLPP
ncbi:MAG: hypothetical protein ACREQQ_18225 [Candidatus Binatia bacterium]